MVYDLIRNDPECKAAGINEDTAELQRQIDEVYK